MSVIRELEEKGERKISFGALLRLKREKYSEKKERKRCQFAWLLIEKVPNTLEENRRLP